jgi:predicted RNA binding protein with dsRBD fold (UPF0201 family)
MESIQKDVKKGNVQVTVEKGTAEKGIKNVAEKGAIRKVIKDSRSEILVCVGDSKNDQKGPEVGVAKKGIQAGVEKDSVQVAIEKMLKRGKKGQLYFSTDFRGVASEGAVKMALSRLNKLGKIKVCIHCTPSKLDLINFYF